jgi:hypothetical protein
LHSSGHFIKEIKEEVGNFISSFVVHIQRKVNCVAHTLARDAVATGNALSWLEEIPINIGDIVIREQVIHRSLLFGSFLFLLSSIRLNELFQNKKNKIEVWPIPASDLFIGLT